MLAVFHTGGNPALLPEEADAAPQRPDRFTVGGNTYVFALDTLTELKGARR